MKIKGFNFLFILLFFTFSLSAQTEKGTISVGLGLKNVSFLSGYAFADANLGVEYFLRDNWSIGANIGTILRSPSFFDKHQNFKLSLSTTKYFNWKEKWKPFVDVQAGFEYNKIDWTDEGVNDRGGNYHNVFIEAGAGIQYNANDNLSLFAKISPKWRMPFKESSSNQFSFDGLQFSFGLKYNFNKKKNKAFLPKHF